MSNSRRSARILIVEDEPALREALGRHMRRAGHLVVTAERAEVALAHCEPGRPAFDVVITDVHLGSMNGLELSTALLSRHPAQRIVMMTGDPDEGLARAGLARRPVGYLLKPFQLFELDAAVNQALALPRELMAQDAATSKNAQLARENPTIGTVPAEWLLWVDDRSFAGVGHADRVARMARVIAIALISCEPETLATLEVAAWSHEIGLLSGPCASPVDVAVRSASMLKECGSTETVIRIVRHMHERWDGTGGPDQIGGFEIPLGAQVLAAADAIDHFAAARIQTGMPPVESSDRAISLVIMQQGTTFSPAVSAAVRESREAVRSIAGVVRRAPQAIADDVPARALPFDVRQRLPTGS